MYKRKARILFFSPDHPDWVTQACLCAADLGADWLEARAYSGPDDLDWADLVVTLGVVWPPDWKLPACTRQVHWPVQAATELPGRIEGMVGGMRMLARLHEDG